MIKSVIVCTHGKLGYSASLRFDNSELNVDISASNKESLYRTIEYIVRKEKKYDTGA